MKRPHRARKSRVRKHAIMERPGELPLSELQAGKKGIVTAIHGGRGMLERVTSLGFVPGTEISILQRLRHGPIIVRVHDARIALGREIARRIHIRRREA